MTVDDALLQHKAADFRPLGQELGQAASNTLPCAVDCTDCTLEEEACFIGISSYVTQLKKFVTGQATRQQPVLLIAEDGLRQEQVARAIHQLSGKPPRSFQPVDTRLYSGTALYELLFAPAGLVEAWRDGAIFIAEAAELPLPLLYRFAVPTELLHLRTGAGELAGPRLMLAMSEHRAAQTSRNDAVAQVVAALQPAVFRLRPLRERSEDISYLVIYMADRIACRLDKGRHNISAEALAMLAAYDWEENIDELETVLESVIAHTPPPEISEALLPSRIRSVTKFGKIPKEGLNLFQALDAYEHELIAQALRQTGGKQNTAAQLLGLKPQTLNTKLKRFQDLSPAEPG